MRVIVPKPYGFVAREVVPSSAVPGLSVPIAAQQTSRGRLDVKNFRFLLEEHSLILPLGQDWDTDPPFNHTYRYPGAGGCTIAIGDVVQYYPLFKGWSPETYTPPLRYSWCGILVDYTVMRPGRKVVKEAISELGKLVEVPEGAVENIGLLRLYSQSELRDIYNGNAGDDKLSYKGSEVLQELSTTQTLGLRDRLLSTDIEGLTLSGVYRTVPVKDVGVNDGAKGKIIVRFDLPWIIFNEAGQKDERTGEVKGAYVSQEQFTVDLSPIEGEGAESDSDSGAR